MTREQAAAEIIKASDQFIEKMEADPGDDVISKQAVLDGLASIAKAKAKSDAQKSLMGRTMFFVEHLPSCTPKHRTGHWIEYTRVLIPEPINKWEQAWKCSECGYGEQDCEDGSAWIEWKFCPNCGAKMEGEK